MLSFFFHATTVAFAFCVTALLSPYSHAQVTAHARHDTLPSSVSALLQKAQIPNSALAAVVLDTRLGAVPRLTWRADVPLNPASTLKLVTTYAALEQLGPDFRWQTKIYTNGSLRDGTLQGNLYLQGDGDPKLVSERLWLLLRRVQGLGIRRISGNIILDRSAFDLPSSDPGGFDGEPLKPYNAAPDALLINYRSQVFSFTPDPEAGVARITMEPPLAGIEIPATVPLAKGSGNACGDWRSNLQADFSNALRPRFNGSYPAVCGTHDWPLAHPEPQRMAARAVAGMWQALGGQLDGQVHDGGVPSNATWRFNFDSPPLAEVVRDTNKYSNNVLAQHIFLTLGRQLNNRNTATRWEDAQQALSRWWQQQFGTTAPDMGNGSGLGRDSKISAGALAQLLQRAWNSGLMPDLAASLPVSGVDGTLRRSNLPAGQAHLKTGSLRDVQALAGYVHGSDGQRRIVVAIVNHPEARAAKPALEALVLWADRGND